MSPLRLSCHAVNGRGGLPASYVLRPPPPKPYRPAGRFGELMSRYRCLSCHSVGGFGGDLSTVPLDRIGSQLKPYIATYLLNPGAVRVSVEARMPVFKMQPGEANAFADTCQPCFSTTASKRTT